MIRPWTDDLPKCRKTSVGQQISKHNINSGQLEDQLCFYCQLEENLCLYGVFDPHNGIEAARFILQRMAVEILFHQLTPDKSHEEIRDILRNAFLSVEKAYIENYDGMIAERTSLQYQLHNLGEAPEPQAYEAILTRLREIDQHLSGSATVVIALIHNNKLYVANVGEARALLCRTDDNSVLRVVQLSAEHSLSNEDELLRLSQLGLDISRLRHAPGLGNQPGTRCLGNYLVKGIYKAFPDIRAATAEPVIPTPEVHGPIMLDDSCRFLILASGTVYKRIQEIKGCNEQANKELAQLVVENFRRQKDLADVSPSVLVEIEQQFEDHCAKHALTPRSQSQTLLIRNFNFPLPNQVCKPEENVVRFNPLVNSKSQTLVDDFSNRATSEVDFTNRTDSTESSSDLQRDRVQYDQNKRIKGYVDFSCYYENVEKARKDGTLPSFIE